jgi:hypothetical protein
VAKDLWQQVDDQDKLFAIRGSDGRIDRLAGSFAAAQLQRVPWYDQDRLVFTLLGLSLLVGVCVAFNVLLRLARRYMFRSSQPAAPANRIALSTLLKTTIIYWLALCATLAVLFSRFDEDSLPPTSAWDKYFLLGDVLLVSAVALSVFAALSAARIWRRPSVSRFSQAKFTLVALACLILSWFAIHWHAITPVHRI